MSNPGVITLESFSIQGQNVRIEDNFGESIHIHIGPFRWDLTCEEFEALAGDMTTLLTRLMDKKGFNPSHFDPLFLGQITSYLPDLVAVRRDTVALKDLQILTLNKIGIPTIAGLKDSGILAAKRGNSNAYAKIRGHAAEQLEDRVRFAEEISHSGTYGANGQLIVLFNDSLVIRDGQHRAAVLYDRDPSGHVDVYRLIFKDNAHNVSSNALVELGKRINRQNLRKMASRGRFELFRLKRRVISKINYLRAGS